ncbi:DUF2285 domain-containing protein [Bradyrhizobium sp. ISRA443]|uniref:DUF2285 domain-containing protein n=1 Tax=unclassified Bradyrhizobium TaxID=2631580 RepID=UPI00247AE023|nr:MULTISPECIES: DUF2285 domain-containing protein [unclassified Bradyrhizobium]WGR93343.1 DUF2285 domain-containing protein [Bradyrhizobium sp. ISRA435]WGR97876.1 DUF2285 domain-containing protein [Bradyrhizobium sp. ISRA436]WGS04766.1 DUF2285 domain-containing protein [Bradyrhizobium sp. ISRA437]WGS11647.1 DUF2285 domain-containing protein [Bradyrhizobium sp. ISRA443]
MFWSPEALSTVLAIRTAICPTASSPYGIDFANLAGSELREAPDGWHAIVPLGGAKHRLWLRELPPNGSSIAVDLPLDRNFDLRLQAAHRFWLALEQRPVGRPPLAQSIGTRHRHILALRAVDGWLEGNSYRNIAQGLFGKPRIPDRGWKTHDLRSRTIRLVRMGLRLIRGGWRDLLRHKGKERDDTS